MSLFLSKITQMGDAQAVVIWYHILGDMKQSGITLEGSDDFVRRIVLDMQNQLFADGIAQSLKNSSSDYEVFQADEADQIPALCRLTSPFALLMEVRESSHRGLSERLIIRNEIKRLSPQCKVVLIVDEQAVTLTDRVMQAKKDGLIDQFIFSSTSAAFFFALVDTL